MLGWTVILSSANILTTVVDNTMKDAMLKKQQQQQERLARVKLDCNLNNVGCVQNICWSNCGPRVNSADWCFTRSRELTSNGSMVLATCKNDEDCPKCLPCASSCIMEGAIIKVNDGDVSIDTN